MSVRSVHAFAEKVALVSDVSNPFGRAVAFQLALQGSFVAAARHPQAGSARLVEELKELGTLAYDVAADVLTVDGSRHAAENLSGELGRLDLLINCLKLTEQSSFHLPESSADDAIADSEANGVVLIHACLPLMSERPRPKIVNLFWVPRESERPIDYDGLARSTRLWAEELPAKYRINAVSVNGSRGRSGFDTELLPMPNANGADDIARIVLFLLSAESIALNGQLLRAAA